jgi:oligoribonuclease
MSDKDSRIVWMDLEMTGLDPLQDDIIEIATLITDKDLNIIAEGPEIIVNQPESRFEKMDDWNQNQHTKSGLWEKVIASTITIEEAEKITLDFIKEHVDERKAPLAGNSIWQDRRFITIHMKNIDKYLHYRMIDVSTLKELGARWYSGMKGYQKKGSHRAMDDIRESIEELKHYKSLMFK